MFRPVDAMKDKSSKTCKPPVPSSKCPIISQKVKTQVVTIKLFRGEYLIDAMLLR